MITTIPSSLGRSVESRARGIARALRVDPDGDPRLFVGFLEPAASETAVRSSRAGVLR